MRSDVFRPDSMNPEDLSDQLAGWLRDRIASGRFKIGERLPPMRALAESSGVSFKTARHAVERLAREGYVNSRPHIGTVVLPKNVTVWRGRVLLVLPDEYETSYFANAFLFEARRRLMEAGYLTSRVCFSRKGDGKCAQLEMALGQCVDFALLMYGTPAIARMLAKAGVPFVSFCGAGASSRNAWRFPEGDGEAKERLVGHCLRAGIRSVTEVDHGAPEISTASSELKAAGIDVRHIVVRPLESCGKLEGIERAAYECFRKLGRRDFPDLFLVWDDYVARGVLTALLSRGIAVPAEVRMAALTNAGFSPVYPKTLTRIEFNPVRYGLQAADFIIAVLSKGRKPSLPVLAPTYVIGETFPP